MTKIVLLAGGLSKEREVSNMSAESVHGVLIDLGYDVIRIDPDRDLAAKILSAKPDLVFNCLHGAFGENGAIPGLLEVCGIPYTHSGINASSMGLNKPIAKRLAESCGVQTPRFLELKKEQCFDILESGQDPMLKPYVIKPAQEGSTFGVYLIIDDASKKPSRTEWSFGDEILIEEYIPGRELTVGVFNGKALGVLEIKGAKNGLYDFASKYTAGLTERIYPAELSEEVYTEAMRASLLVHNTLGCRTISRVDFRYNPQCGSKNGLYFIEINTHPGFTQNSMLPAMAKHNNIPFKQIVEQLIKDARCESGVQWLLAEFIFTKL